MSFLLRCSLGIEFELYEHKYLNSNHLDSKFVTLSTFSGSMLEVCGLVHPKEHDELSSALQFRGHTANIRCLEITRPKPRPPFVIEILTSDGHDGQDRRWACFVMDNGSTG
jgi:hypothetical protein